MLDVPPVKCEVSGPFPFWEKDGETRSKTALSQCSPGFTPQINVSPLPGYVNHRESDLYFRI